jgi:hypothetical protein
VRLALVHLGSDEQAGELFGRFGLEDLPRFADPQGELYTRFGLGRGGALQFLTPRVWWRAIAALLKGHGFGKPVGDARRMPGAFLVDKGVVVRAFRHATVADRPDYEALYRAT